jgi:hypothetical protein
VAAVADAEARLTKLREDSNVPAEPDRRWADQWLHSSYFDYWTHLPHSLTSATSRRTVASWLR